MVGRLTGRLVAGAPSAGVLAYATVLTGTVLEFDDAAGLGRIRASDGGIYAFHCIEIADGTREIDAGQPVLFDRLARFGQFQAGRIHKV